jgi:hypothetical protein
MFELTDESGRVLLAEAETFANAKFAARTMADEGTPCPILISLGDSVVASLVEGPHGRMIETSDLVRSLR